MFSLFYTLRKPLQHTLKSSLLAVSLPVFWYRLPTADFAFFCEFPNCSRASFTATLDQLNLNNNYCCFSQTVIILNSYLYTLGRDRIENRPRGHSLDRTENTSNISSVVACMTAVTFTQPRSLFTETLLSEGLFLSPCLPAGLQQRRLS